MRLLLILLLFFSCFAIKAQTYLYNQDGISLSYTSSVVKTFYCDKDKKDVYYLKLTWTLSNNSGKSAKIYYGFTVYPTNQVSWCTPQGVYDEVTQPINQPFGTGFGDAVVLKTGSQTFGGYYLWSVERNFFPGYNIGPIYFTDNSATTPSNNTYPKSQSISPAKQQTNTKTSNTNTIGNYGIYQNDNVVSPRPATNYSQQQQQNAATDNAMKSYQNTGEAYNDELKRLNNIPNTYGAPTNSQQQQEEIKQRQQQIAAQQQEKLNQLQQRIEEQQRRYQQTQIELENAKDVSINAYQEAINSGKKQSGAMVDATLAGASQISDAKSSLIYTGVGLGISLFAHLAEKKAERKERELADKKETERIQRGLDEDALTVNTKTEFLKEALRINQYSYTDMILKPRYAALLLVPKDFGAYEQQIYFTNPVEIPKYSDSTYPLKDYVQKKLLESLNNTTWKSQSVYTLYPITDVEKFSTDFVKKMGSGTVIKLDAQLIEYSKLTFEKNTQESADTDFWGNPVKKDNKVESKPAKKENSFWNN